MVAYQIQGLVCRYCAALRQGEAAVLPPDTAVILEELPCAGQLEPRRVLEAFAAGADAVFVWACPAKACFHRQGNDLAALRIKRLRRLLADIGLEEERMVYVTADMPAGHSLPSVVREVWETLQRCGVSPLRGKAACEVKP